MALHDRDVKRYFATGIAGLSVVADSLSAIKYAKVKTIRDENGIVTDYKVEGDYPKYGNNDDFVLLVGILIRCLIVGHELHRRVGRSPVDDEVLHVVATLRRHAVERSFQHFFGVVCAGDNRKFYHFCKIFW